MGLWSSSQAGGGTGERSPPCGFPSRAHARDPRSPGCGKEAVGPPGIAIVPGQNIVMRKWTRPLAPRRGCAHGNVETARNSSKCP